MPTVRQKNSTLTKLAVFFGNARKVMTKHEYMTTSRVPVRMNVILRTFGTYERMLNCLKEQHGYLDGMEEADKLENVKPAPKAVEEKPKAVKAAPAPKTAAMKPEAKVTPKKEESDGKDL